MYPNGNPHNRRVLKQKTSYSKLKLSILGIVVLCLGIIFFKINNSSANQSKANIKTPSSISSNLKNNIPPKNTTPAPVNECASNQLAQLVLVKISARHLWACSYQTVLYNSPVVTGMDFLAADITPTGTYHIESMQRDIYLKGSDSTGSWDDFVHYWMQFLYNQYGAYGLHDATWRPANAFGNISPSSSNASHGCVELPLATASWLYNWVQLGTTVQIEN